MTELAPLVLVWAKVQLIFLKTAWILNYQISELSDFSLGREIHKEKNQS